MNFKHRSYGMPFAHNDPSILYLPRKYRVMDAMLEYLHVTMKVRGGKIRSDAVVRQGCEIYQPKETFSDKDTSKRVGFFCAAQDLWLGAISPYDARCALEFCEALEEIGGKARLDIYEVGEREDRKVEMARLCHPQNAKRKAEVRARGADIARVMGWVLLKGGSASLPDSIYAPDFFRDHTRRREGNGQAFGMQMLMEDMKHAQQNWVPVPASRD